NVSRAGSTSNVSAYFDGITSLGSTPGVASNTKRGCANAPTLHWSANAQAIASTLPMVLAIASLMKGRFAAPARPVAPIGGDSATSRGVPECRGDRPRAGHFLAE